jgi:hypothetical protein
MNTPQQKASSSPQQVNIQTTSLYNRHSLISPSVICFANFEGESLQLKLQQLEGEHAAAKSKLLAAGKCTVYTSSIRTTWL